MMGAWVVAAALGAPLTAGEVVSAALARDPALAEAQAAVLAAEGERKGATGLRHDPTLEVRVGFGLPQHEASLTQPLSLSGEGIADARAAKAGLAAARAELDRRKLEVAAEARRAMIRAIAADASVERADEVFRLATELRSAAEARLATGDAPELELHLARLEEAAAAADRVQARREALAAREHLAATTGLSLGAELPDDPMLAAPTGSGGTGRADQLAAAARLDSAEAALGREKAAALPPVELGVWAQVQDLADDPGASGAAPWSWSETAGWTIGPSLSLTLPLWSANREGIARAAGDRDLAASRLAATEARIATEQAGNALRRDAIDAVAGTSTPTPEARAALAGVDAAAAAGELGGAEAAVLRTRIVDAWRRGSTARAAAAEMVVELALVESWPELLGR